jgi:hypothetical protein
MLKLLRTGLVAAAFALMGHAAVAQIDAPGYFTFELSAVEAGGAPYLGCIAERSCNRATKVATTGNGIARQVYEDIRAGRLPLHRGPLDVYFYTYGSSGQASYTVYIQDGAGVRAVQAVRGCTNVTNIPELGGTPEYCFHLQGTGEVKIAFPREFFSGHTYAAWCAPSMKNGIRPAPGEGIPYVKEEINDKLAGKGGWPNKTVTFMLVQGYSQPAPAAQAAVYGYQPPPGYAPQPRQYGRDLYRH